MYRRKHQSQQRATKATEICIRRLGSVTATHRAYIMSGTSKKGEHFPAYLYFPFSICDSLYITFRPILLLGNEKNKNTTRKGRATLTSSQLARRDLLAVSVARRLANTLETRTVSRFCICFCFLFPIEVSLPNRMLKIPPKSHIHERRKAPIPAFR